MYKVVDLQAWTRPSYKVSDETTKITNGEIMDNDSIIIDQEHIEAMDRIRHTESDLEKHKQFKSLGKSLTNEQIDILTQ